MHADPVGDVSDPSQGVDEQDATKALALNRLSTASLPRWAAGTEYLGRRFARSSGGFEKATLPLESA